MYYKIGDIDLTYEQKTRQKAGRNIYTQKNNQ